MEKGFVDLCEAIPGLRCEIRYATAHNLTGHPLAGYLAPRAIGTVQMAGALRGAFGMAQAEGFGLLVYDAYRPQKAVDDFVRWSKLPEDGATKQEFYPALAKEDLFALGYIALRSGHSRGSTVDLTLTRDGQPADLGTGFDYMGEESHHSYLGLPEETLMLRRRLKALMEAAGFRPYDGEWWHYTLIGEPYPDTLFDFDIT